MCWQATVSEHQDRVPCTVSHAACFLVRRKVPHVLVPAVRSTRSCHAMRSMCATRFVPRWQCACPSRVAIDCRCGHSNKRRQTGIDRTVHRHHKCASEERRTIENNNRVSPIK